jgi:hypothetical protein
MVAYIESYTTRILRLHHIEQDLVEADISLYHKQLDPLVVILPWTPIRSPPTNIDMLT